MRKLDIQRLLNWIGLLLAAAALFYLGRSFSEGLRQESLSDLLSFHVGLFVASFLVLMVHMLLAALSWKMVSGVVGCPVTFRQAFAIHFLTQVGKYLPGKLWAAVGKVGLTRRLGLSGVRASHAMVLESLFIVSGSLLVGLPLVPVAADRLGLGPVLSLAAVALVVLVLIMTCHPTAFQRLLRWLSRITGKELEAGDPGFLNVLKLLPVYLLVFLSQGVAFVLLAWSFGLRIPMFPGMFVFPMAMAIGFIVVFAPGGLGVREVSLTWLVGLATAAGAATAGGAELVSIAARLWITLAEGVAFIAALMAWGGRRAIGAIRSEMERTGKGGGRDQPQSTPSTEM